MTALRGASSRAAPVRFDLPAPALLATVLLASVLRALAPGAAADAAFCAAVAIAGSALFRDPAPRAIRPALALLAALAALYAAGLAAGFDLEGARNLSGVLFASVLFAFGYANGLDLARSRWTIPVLLGALLALSAVYVSPAGVNPNVFGAIAGYVFLVAGLVLVVRSEDAEGGTGWAHCAFLAAAAVGLAFGARSLVLAILAAFLVYWTWGTPLRGRAGALALAAVLAAAVGAAIWAVRSPQFERTFPNIDAVAKKYSGTRFHTGRRALWGATLESIAESPWTGAGPGARIGRTADAAPHCLSAAHPQLFDDCAILQEASKHLTSDPERLWEWDFGRPLESWPGVAIGGAPARVVGLDLRRMELDGRIPSVLGGLDALVSLRLDGNRLSGAVPPELGSLARLAELGLAGNALGGAVPPELGELGELSVLRLAGNDFAGCPPPALLDVGDHDLFSDGRLFCAADVRARRPDLTADFDLLLSVRGELAGETNLNWSESIPVGSWRGVRLQRGAPRVVAIDLADAGSAARLPPELGALDRLVSLRLDGASLSGPVPEEWERLAALVELDLGGAPPIDPAQPAPGSAFCAPSPPPGSGLDRDCALLLRARDALAGGAALNWRRSTPIGAWRGVTVGGAPPRVRVLDLSGAGLRGRIPPELGGLERLAALRLDGNRLAGPAPAELAALEELAVLRLDGNLLEGCLPWPLRGLDRRLPEALELPWCGPPAPGRDPSFESPGAFLSSVNRIVSPLTHSGFHVSAHNQFLQTGLHAGVPGIAVLGLLFLSLLLLARSRPGRPVRPAQRYLAACAALIVVHSTFEVFLFRVNIAVLAWLLLGMAARAVAEGAPPPATPRRSPPGSSPSCRAA